MADQKVKETEEHLKKMKAQLNGVVDINYKRYNNEYMDVAAEHMNAMKKERKQKADDKYNEGGAEAADILFNKLRGRTIL